MAMYLLRFLLIIVALAFTCVEEVALQRLSKRGSNFLKHFRNIKRRDLNDISDVSANSCNNIINESTIIRANESIANGAIYIKVLEGQTQQQCINSCCSTVNCTLAVYENKNANDCFLFNCGYPTKCYFSHYDFYRSINFQMSSVKHKLGTSTKTHEDELAKLYRKKTTQQPTTIAPTTTTPPLPVELFAHCDPRDTCSDTHASCLEERCACEAGYQAKYGKCRQPRLSQSLAQNQPIRPQVRPKVISANPQVHNQNTVYQNIPQQGALGYNLGREGLRVLQKQTNPKPPSYDAPQTRPVENIPAQQARPSPTYLTGKPQVPPQRPDAINARIDPPLLQAQSNLAATQRQRVENHRQQVPSQTIAVIPQRIPAAQAPVRLQTPPKYPPSNVNIAKAQKAGQPGIKQDSPQYNRYSYPVQYPQYDLTDYTDYNSNLYPDRASYRTNARPDPGYDYSYNSPYLSAGYPSRYKPWASPSSYQQYQPTNTETLAKQAPHKNVSKEQQGGVQRPMLPDTHNQPLPNNQNTNQGNRQRPYQPNPDQNKPYRPNPDQNQPYQPNPDQNKPYRPNPDQNQPYQPNPDQNKPYRPNPDQNQPYHKTSKQSRPLQNTNNNKTPQPSRELQPSINNKQPDGSESGQVSSGAKSDKGQEQVNQELDGGPVEGEKVTGGKKGGKIIDAGEKFPEKVDADAVKEEHGGKVDGAGLKKGRKSSVVIIKKKGEESEWSLTPIIVLALGLAITGVLLTFVACRLRTVKRRIRKGRPLHSHEADYLINGMYL